MDAEGRFKGREYGGLRLPEVDTQFRIGNTSVYVFEIEGPTTYENRTRMICHDDAGNEVEILFHPLIGGEDATEVCQHCGRDIALVHGVWVDPTVDDIGWRETCDAHDTFDAEHEPEA